MVNVLAGYAAFKEILVAQRAQRCYYIIYCDTDVKIIFAIKAIYSQKSLTFKKSFHLGRKRQKLRDLYSL